MIFELPESKEGILLKVRGGEWVYIHGNRGVTGSDGAYRGIRESERSAVGRVGTEAETETETEAETEEGAGENSEAEAVERVPRGGEREESLEGETS